VPWQAVDVGTRVAVLALLALLPPALTACTSSSDPAGPGPTARTTTAAQCAEVLTDDVFATLGWTPTGEPAESTVRGCHREAEQGYVEVRERRGYDELCATLDRTGQVGPGTPVDWLGERTACAVEPDAEVGSTVVVVKGTRGRVTQVTVAAVAPTPRSDVRAAVAELLGA
jgi:hypothetical protein